MIKFKASWYDSATRKHHCEWVLDGNRSMQIGFDIAKMGVSENTLHTRAKVLPLSIKPHDNISSELIEGLMNR